MVLQTLSESWARFLHFIFLTVCLLSLLKTNYEPQCTFPSYWFLVEIIPKKGITEREESFFQTRRFLL